MQRYSCACSQHLLCRLVNLAENRAMAGGQRPPSRKVGAKTSYKHGPDQDNRLLEAGSYLGLGERTKQSARHKGKKEMAEESQI
ncbi:MAG: hypothetical protein ACYSW4_00455 [Planctomycetota bacterium]